MNLHEYQAKNLLREKGIAVPRGLVIQSAEQIDSILAQAKSEFSSERWVVKAQVHAGGRGKAGGVKLVSGVDEAKEIIQSLLGQRLVTYQTDADGQPINQILVEETCQIATELYLGAVIDRACQRLVFMVSTEGGVEIEKVAEETPEKIAKIVVDPHLGVMPYQCREVGFALGFDSNIIKQLTKLISQLCDLARNSDFSLLEINPLVITEDNQLICLDAKINIDENAGFRQPALMALRDKTQEDERENHAKEWDLNYIALDGNIGCMVNGAGLAMATMDLIKLQGGEPANFLDVGGGATKERVTEAFKIILSDTNVKAILVNIFGGIVRCDLIADGIINALNEIDVHVPVVVRLEGTNADIGSQKLNECGLNIIAAENLHVAAEKVVACINN